MYVRWCLLAVLLIPEVGATHVASATERSMTRSEIRATPLLQRPYRPGHFYGNTVRRRSGQATQ